MRIKKSWKIGISVISVAAVASTTLAVLLYPINNNAPLSTYMLEFNGDTEKAGKKNGYMKELKSKTSNILSNYKENVNPKSKGLDFSFANLTSAQSSGELNYFDTMNRTMRAISPDLGITNHQRTPALVQEAFYNRNTEMQSFYWSPDYNGIGTWTKYMFTDNYVLPNMWHSAYA
ncbi:MAG: MG321/MPN456 family lipoprotein, partial [Mycoplasma sp.]